MKMKQKRIFSIIIAIVMAFILALPVYAGVSVPITTVTSDTKPSNESKVITWTIPNTLPEGATLVENSPYRYIKGEYQHPTIDQFNGAYMANNDGKIGQATIHENGVYTVMVGVKDTNGEVTISGAIVTVDGIDKIAPTLKVLSTKKTGENEYTCTVEVTDNVGVVEMRYGEGTISNENYSQATITNSATFVAKTNTNNELTYTFFAKDAAGNISRIDIKTNADAETIIRDCPEGYTWNAKTELCEKSSTTVIRCESNQTYNFETGQCEDIDTSCPDGYVWDETLRICYQITCPEGTTYDEDKGACIPDDCDTGECEPSCPEGTELNPETGLCEIPGCPEDHPYYNPETDECLNCEDGLLWDSSTYMCVCPDGSMPDENGSCEPQGCGDNFNCPEGYTMTDDCECLPPPVVGCDDSQPCPDGQHMNEDCECVKTPIPTPNVGCDDDTITCEDGYYLDANCECQKKIPTLPQTGGDASTIILISSAIALAIGVGTLVIVRARKK